MTKDRGADQARIELHVLTPERMPDFLRFFDEDAFADNPRWASCYCQCFYEDHRVVSWNDRTHQENRRFACDRGADGTMRGHLAYVDGAVAGWCNAAPRTLLHALDAEGPIDDAALVGSIACFIVDPAARGRGIARALLDAACEGFRRDGLRIAEAYPRAPNADPAANHFGPLQLYLSAGFTITRVEQDGSLIVRRAL